MTKQITTIPVEHKVLAVIDNFQCDVPEIELTKYLSIRRIDTLPDDEKAVFWGQQTVVRSLNWKPGEPDFQEQLFHVIRYQSASGDYFKRTLERGNYVLRWHIKEHVRV